MSLRVIGPEAERHLDWVGVARAIEAGHAQPRAQVEDVFLRRGADTLLNRSAWIEGLGIAVKVATVFPANRHRPTIGGAVNLLSDADGSLLAVLDFGLVTKWKTAGDSLLGALRLARPDSREVLVLGAGTVARSLVEAYRAGFPGARVTLWNRTRGRAEALAAETGAEVAGDLAEAVGRADIVACATMASEPVLRGEWLRPGQHIDLIGAYRPDMREADDEALRRARLFCDSRQTTIHHIGEFRDPIARGVIAEADILADLYDGPAMARASAEEITLYKNGGGAHLDLMVSRHILAAVDRAETGA
jgi:ornithine cyclodeaminase/alanine dehydrogenase-like protein (mu-crystallin family)